MLQTFDACLWNTPFSQQNKERALREVENGQILYFPQLEFNLSSEEKTFLSPDYADPHAKNISYHATQNKMWGTQHLTDDQHHKLKNMLDRFSRYAFNLIDNLLPNYSHHLIVARTSFRPVQISNRKTSVRKDDKRLHVDAFPSAPNQGKRILRVFANINPHGEARIWRTGETFEKVAQQFLPRTKKPIPCSAALLRLLKITKSYRSLYDHYMLQIHDGMKADDNYQKTACQQEIHFSSSSTWIVQTDQVSHAAMKGQYVLEQTFYLPVQYMHNETLSPLRILEKMLGQGLAP